MAGDSLERILSWLPRALLLLAIWGVAVFLWGTFGAWTRDQYLSNEARMAEANAPAIAAWLKNLTDPLERLAADPRLSQGMELPAGVTSLPVQRVLYEFAYLNGQSEVYIADLRKNRVGRTAGASQLSPEVPGRLADMDDTERMVLGYGQRNGQVLLGHKVNAAMPHRLVVMVPAGLSSLAASQPLPRLPAERELAILLPHTAGWARWNAGSAGFVLDDDLTQVMKHGERVWFKDKHMLVLVPLPDWPDVWLGVQSPNQIVGTRMLPQLLVALWALMMSALVMWNDLGVYRRKVLEMGGPVMAPLGKIGKPLAVTVASLAARMRDKMKAMNAEKPLVEGPGMMDQRDFVSSAEMLERMNRGVKRPRGGGALKLAKNGAAGVPEKVERRKRQRGATDGRPAPKMNWPEQKAPAPRKHEDVRDDQLDPEDMKAVVEDCLKKKRILLLYQPIYSADGLMPVMHEVYARLMKSTGEIINPDVFLPVATQHHMTLDLDIAVLRRVVHEHFSGGGAPKTALALNISSTSLDGIAYLQEMANQGPRVLQKLGFEVRSQEMIRDPKAMKLLKDLQRHGGNLAVDYFGGGTAMLDASKAMGFNYVKLNGMRLMGTDAGKKEIIQLSQHARKIGLPVILEMLGTDEAVTFAKRAGVEFLQGYALMRPQEHMTTEPLPPSL